MTIKVSYHDQTFYHGITAALAVIAIHDQPSLALEILDTLDLDAYLAVAYHNGDLETIDIKNLGLKIKAKHRTSIMLPDPNKQDT